MSPDELALIKQKFYKIARIPNCIGAIDCTLIPILSPKEREDVYVCRKGYHAINVQAVVDTNMKFTNVVAKWPGSTHDNIIFENCGLKQWIENGIPGWLIGDSGYALKSYMLTPKINPSTRQEVSFNNAHSRTRMVVERAFGILKSRFR
ncbi:putative nuclease HARBI1, partial [Ruditapes philippinarum]|uniref:putative nuclease HARBI1 n=1 Tax=Ruditapes philippinarum TaxID=129788 RepID=UPI00295BB385